MAPQPREYEDNEGYDGGSSGGDSGSGRGGSGSSGSGRGSGHSSARYSSTVSLTVTATETATSTSTNLSLPPHTTIVSAADTQGRPHGASLVPAAIILPVVIGFAVLLLAVGSFFIWRRKRRDAAVAAESDGSISSAAGSISGLRGGDLGGAVAPGEKYNPNFQGGPAVRMMHGSSFSSLRTHDDPFADPGSTESIVADGFRGRRV